MSARAFIDTNVFVYSADLREGGKFTVAGDLIAQLIKSREACTSYQVVQEFINVVVKKFSSPLPNDEIQRYLAVIFRNMRMINSSAGLFEEAFNIFSRYRLSWYDSLIVAAASEARCSVIYTEDLQHGAKINGIRIENPFR